MKNASVSSIKKILWEIFVLIMACVVAAIVCWWNEAGVLIDKPLDVSVIDEANIAKREIAITNATSATVIVTNIDKYKYHGITAVLVGYPEVDVAIHLSQKDVSKIDPGDTITVRGKFYYEYDASDNEHPHSIMIGDYSQYRPWSFYAKIVNISHDHFPSTGANHI